MDLTDFADEKLHPIDFIRDTFDKFKMNVVALNHLKSHIDKLESTEQSVLESMYMKEFNLYMDHIAIYDDLINYIERELKSTTDNKFELKRIQQEAKKMLQVAVVEI